MKTKSFTATLATTALAVVVPLVTIGTGVAAAAPDHATRPAVEVRAGSGEATASICSKPPTARHPSAKADPAPSRLSGLPFGGAATYNGPPPTAQHASAQAGPAPSRLSGLPFGGAGVCA